MVASGLAERRLDRGHGALELAVVVGPPLERRDRERLRHRCRAWHVRPSDRRARGTPAAAPRLGTARGRHLLAQRREPGEAEQPPLAAVRYLDRDAVAAERVQQRRRVLDGHVEGGGERGRRDQGCGGEHVHRGRGARGAAPAGDSRHRAARGAPGVFQPAEQRERVSLYLKRCTRVRPRSAG